METKTNQQQILFFCEDCGKKNFIKTEDVLEKGKEVKFRCQECDYLNTVLSPGPPKKS